jgi:hypothetical protein
MKRQLASLSLPPLNCDRLSPANSSEALLANSSRLANRTEVLNGITQPTPDDRRLGVGLTARVIPSLLINCHMGDRPGRLSPTNRNEALGHTSPPPANHSRVLGLLIPPLVPVPSKGGTIPVTLSHAQRLSPADRSRAGGSAEKQPIDGNGGSESLGYNSKWDLSIRQRIVNDVDGRGRQLTNQNQASTRIEQQQDGQRLPVDHPQQLIQQQLDFLQTKRHGGPTINNRDSVISYQS